MSGNRLYSDKEIGALIQRATELHEGASDTQDHALSLEDVEHIASELGISPEHVRSAALELAHNIQPDKKFSLFGAPFFVDHARVIPEPMGEEQWELVVAELRQITGSTGKQETIGQTKEWSKRFEDMGTTLSATRVSARSDGEQTSLNLKSQFGGLGYMSYYVTLILTGIGSVIFLDEVANLSNALNFLLLGGSIAGAFALVRTGIHLWGKQQKKKLNAIADRIHHTISSHARAPAVASTHEEAVPASLLDISDEELPEDMEIKSNQRIRS